MSKGGKVFTIFSTSKDHNQGSKAMAGCILVDFENLQVINRSHAYKNVYVHRRDSVSIEQLSKQEIDDRTRLGLITENPSIEEDEESEGSFEEFDESEDSSSEDDDGQFSYTGRSSVDPTQCMSSPPGQKAGATGTFDFAAMASPNISSKRITMQRISEDEEDTVLGEDSMDL